MCLFQPFQVYMFALILKSAYMIFHMRKKLKHISQCIVKNFTLPNERSALCPWLLGSDLLSPRNALLDKIVFICWGLWTMPDNLSVWLMVRGFEGQSVSLVPPDGLGTEVNCADSPPCLTEPNKNTGQKNVRELPWWAVFCAYSRVSMLVGVKAGLDSIERAKPDAVCLESSCTLSLASLPFIYMLSNFDLCFHVSQL